MTDLERSASAPCDPFHLVGTLLERKYRVDSVVAEGGFGIVYAGHHLGLDAKIAIKALRPQKKLDDEEWADLLVQFLAEAKALAKLRSPHVVTVFDAGVTHTEDAPGGVPWIVLEWIEGETLAEDLARRGGLGRTPAEALDLLRGVIAAIAEAHASGIAHRDLKPTNVMLETSARGATARVLDFGIAKIMEVEDAPSTGATATSATYKAYSPAYAAPEQVSGMRTGPWTDVHALGLLLTEVVTGRAPYPTGDPNELYRCVFDPVRPTPARFGVDVGPWESILARALAIKPADRFASAGELLAALEAKPTAPPTRVVLSSVPPPPNDLPYALTERSDRAVVVQARTRRPRAPLVVGGALAMAAAIGAVAFGRRASAPAPAVRPSAAATCTTNAACSAALGAPAICARDRSRCVALASEDCAIHAEPAARDDADTVWFGTLFPTSAPNATDGIANTQAVELARRDFAQMTAGMTQADASTKLRPFGVLACDDAKDAKRAAAHLVDVGVAAVIGFQSSVEAIDLVSSVFLPNQILTVSATNINPLVTTVPHPPGVPRLVWRTTYNALDTAHTMSAFVARVLEPRARGKSDEPIRVALVRQKNAPGAAFADELFRSLTFNGKSAFANGAAFRELTYEREDELAPMVPELTKLAPHVILYVVPNEAALRLFAPLEAAWPVARAPRPVYVGGAHFDPPLLDFIGGDRDRRRRFYGITVVSSLPENARFVMHYNETFAADATLTRGPNTAYDAFYALAYAAIASGAQVDGPALSRSLARLNPPGRRVEVGMSGIFGALTALQAGENIDLIGSSGSLELDAKTGEVRLDQVVLCPGIDARGRATDGVESGLVYRTALGKLEGTLACP